MTSFGWLAIHRSGPPEVWECDDFEGLEEDLGLYLCRQVHVCRHISPLMNNDVCNLGMYDMTIEDISDESLLEFNRTHGVLMPR